MFTFTPLTNALGYAGTFFLFSGVCFLAVVRARALCGVLPRPTAHGRAWSSIPPLLPWTFHRAQVWMFFFVPETRGKTLEEIEDMLRNGRIR